jgi:hypothetical protein
MSLGVLVVTLSGQIRNREQPPPRCFRFCEPRQARLAVQVDYKASRDAESASARPLDLVTSALPIKSIRVVPRSSRTTSVSGVRLPCPSTFLAGGTMDFEFDMFVSYAHVDNTAADEHQKGWVAKLHEELDRRLTQRATELRRLYAKKMARAKLGHFLRIRVSSTSPSRPK